MEAENLLLKQQVQPHFLFNALSTMKSLYREDIDKGEDYLLHLSDFLRAAIQHNQKSIVPLIEELKFCKNYLFMQQIKTGNAIRWEINIEIPETRGIQVPSFTLQPLIENAIKHNRFSSDNPLTICITLKDGILEIINNLAPLPTKTEITTKSGLHNLSERLRILSGEALHISEDNNYFRVSLKTMSA